MRQPDRRAATRTPGQPPPESAAGWTWDRREHGFLCEIVSARVCVCVRARAHICDIPFLFTPPLFKILHKSAALLAVSFPLLEERECSCVFPLTVLVESAWVKGVTIL